MLGNITLGHFDMRPQTDRNNAMSSTPSNRYAPAFFGVAGILFLIAGYIGNDISFYGIGAMFCIFGISGLLKKKTPNTDDVE